MDVSYTRTQRGSIGVTRVVRHLLSEFRKTADLQGQWTCQPVAIHSKGFRLAELAQDRPGPGVGTQGSAASAVLRKVTSGRAREWATRSVPAPLLQAAWQQYSRWTFDTLSEDAEPVAWEPGDVLFLADAAWHYRSWEASQLARDRGAKVVLLVYDLIPLTHPEHCAPLVSRLFEKWLKHMLACCDAIICISQATERDLRMYASNRSLPLPPMASFRLGCNPVQEPSSSSGRVRPAISSFLSGIPAFTAVGSLEPRKNYAWLLEVFERLWLGGHDVRLLIIGRPTADGRAFLDRAMRHPEQGRRLRVATDANDDELSYAYGHSRALVFPSLAEGFGLPLVEARTRGCPVIASGLPAFQELSDEGVWLHAPDSIEELSALLIAHSREDWRCRVGVMPAFTWSDSAQECLQVLGGLLAS